MLLKSSRVFVPGRPAVLIAFQLLEEEVGLSESPESPLEYEPCTASVLVLQ